MLVSTLIEIIFKLVKDDKIGMNDDIEISGSNIKKRELLTSANYVKSAKAAMIPKTTHNPCEIRTIDEFRGTENNDCKFNIITNSVNSFTLLSEDDLEDIFNENLNKVAYSELLQLVIKAKPLPPNLEGDGYDPDGNMIYDIYRCPSCDKSYEVECEKYDYCPACGQRIDWEGILDE